MANSRKTGTYLKIIVLILFLIFSIFLEIFTGPAGFLSNTLILKLRVLRLILGIFCGISLSLSGAVLQGILRNPLCDPYILGVAGSACLGAIFGKLFLNFYQPFSLLFAVISIFIIYRLGSIRGVALPHTLILSGVIVSTFVSSLTMILMVLHGESLSQIIYFLMGRLSVIPDKLFYISLTFSYFFLLICIFLFIKYSQALNLLSLGEYEALSCGVDVNKLRFKIFILSGVLTALTVMLCGAIGFVGLCVPHLARLCIGADYKKVLKSVLLIGPSLLLISDTLSRIWTIEFPISVVTSLFGVPFFIYLLRKNKKFD